ncbi:MAG TPA: response regulator transcription factor [Acidimicrobiales bacterium]|nr:response regulator transcription factor [Acidimicrobiales bacterium]
MDGAYLLVVEDDKAIASALQRVFQAEGATVSLASNGAEALAHVSGSSIDMVVLDLGLPDVDGLEICRRLRAARPDVEILILTARDQEIDIVLGLDAGADDYLSKPFRLAELLARIRARLRHQAASGHDVTIGGLRVALDARRVYLDGREVELRPKEFDLLAALVARPGTVITRDQLLAEAWDPYYHGSTKTLDMHISTLRRKLGDVAITTIRGLGYRLEARS